MFVLFVCLQTFHTPSFGDEEFSVPQGYGLNPHQGHYSAHVHDPGSSNHQFTQPLSHPPITSHLTNGQQQNNHHIDAWGVPKFPPQNFDIPDISVQNNSSFQNNLHFYHKPPGGPVCNNVTTASQFVPSSQAQLMTIGQLPTNSKLGLKVTSPRNSMDNRQTSPTGSNNTSPGRESSEESSDDSLPLAQVGRPTLNTGGNLVSIKIMFDWSARCC